MESPVCFRERRAVCLVLRLTVAVVLGAFGLLGLLFLPRTKDGSVPALTAAENRVDRVCGRLTVSRDAKDSERLSFECVDGTCPHREECQHALRKAVHWCMPLIVPEVPAGDSTSTSSEGSTSLESISIDDLTSVSTRMISEGSLSSVSGSVREETDISDIDSDNEDDSVLFNPQHSAPHAPRAMQMSRPAFTFDTLDYYSDSEESSTDGGRRHAYENGRGVFFNCLHKKMPTCLSRFSRERAEASPSPTASWSSPFPGTPKTSTAAAAAALLAAAALVAASSLSRRRHVRELASAAALDATIELKDGVALA